MNRTGRAATEGRSWSRVSIEATSAQCTSSQTRTTGPLALTARRRSVSEATYRLIVSISRLDTRAFISGSSGSESRWPR